MAPARGTGIATLGISLLGAGRMGSEVLRALARGDRDARLAGVWVRQGSSVCGADMTALAGDAGAGVHASSDLAAVIAAADVAIDFTLPAATREILAAVTVAGTPLVSGVSGQDADGLQAIREAARLIPIFYERNMSVGIAVLRRLTSEAAALLGPDFVASIDDVHHAGKRDSPSGTALMLGESLAGAGHSAAVEYRVTREGTCPGSHTVRLQGDAEVLTLAHEALDRRLFAGGALRAAHWLRGRSPGLYDMQDLLADAPQDGQVSGAGRRA